MAVWFISASDDVMLMGVLLAYAAVNDAFPLVPDRYFRRYMTRRFFLKCAHISRF